MSFDWTDYLSLAQELVNAPLSGRRASHEAFQRSAVSRAYYAVFASARNHLRDVDGMVIPTRNAHQLVAIAYQRGQRPERFQIGLNLNRLRIERNKCDYDDEVSNLAEVTSESLAVAAETLESLTQL